MWMAMKNGVHPCSKCGGTGCYWCQKSGVQILCPQCGNSEPGLFNSVEGGRQCIACSATFGADGLSLRVDVVDEEEDTTTSCLRCGNPSATEGASCSGCGAMVPKAS